MFYSVECGDVIISFLRNVDNLCSTHKVKHLALKLYYFLFKKV